MKVCTKCGVEKEESEFYIRKSNIDGLRSNCKKCERKSNKKYYEKNKENIIKHSNYYYEKNKEMCVERMNEYYQNNREKCNISSKEYYQNNKEKCLKSSIDLRKKRRKHDFLFKLTENISTLIRMSIINKGFKKSSRTSAILGCSFEEFKLHIEKQFADGMTWDNRHLWHLDHIYPVSLAESEEHLIQLNHYTNFQPLWAADNIRKGNKIPEDYKNA
ncbi:MAG: hypothetical protein PHG08_00715 [Bacilli bacterium]|nr:hypothetical protein [Bacilli bacterium]